MICLVQYEIIINFIYKGICKNGKALFLSYDFYAFLSGGRYTIRLGDKEVEYNLKFRFYICTKMSNPHYTPEISTKTTIVNFSVKEQGTSQ